MTWPEGAETQGISVEKVKLFEFLSDIKDELENKCKIYPAFGAAIGLEYQGKWVTAEKNHNSIKMKIYDSLERLKNDYKDREEEVFVYQIGMDNIGSLRYIIQQIGSGVFAPIVQAVSEAELDEKQKLEKIVA